MISDKRLYGLKSGTRTDLVSADSRLSEEDIAKEVGITERTFHRAQKIQKSNLPDPIKKVTLNGELAIRPVAELLNEPEPVQKEVVAIITKNQDILEILFQFFLSQFGLMFQTVFFRLL